MTLVICRRGAPQGPRLPENVYPEHYDLHVETDMTAFLFRGSVKIDVAVPPICMPVGVGMNAVIDARAWSSGDGQ